MAAQLPRNNALTSGASFLVAAVGIAAMSASSGPGSTTACVVRGLFALNVFGLAAGLHQYFAYQSFKTRPWLRAARGLFGAWASQGPLTTWVTDQRRHDRFADRLHDPHSPWADETDTIAWR